MRTLKVLVIGLLLGIPLLACFLTIPALALVNPAAAYCQALGYNYTIESTELGDVGLCQLPNGQTVDAWDFLRGKVALEWSYCAREGYEARHVEDSEICRDCTVCVLPDGTEVEVTKLMGLSFGEPVCGDGMCVFPENYESCSQDCPSGSADNYCDGVEDGICDPDCEEGADPDCEATLPLPAPANFVFSSLNIVPPEIEAGKNVTVSVNVTNTGKAESSATVTLRVEGEIEESRELVLGSGASESVAFTVTRDDPGTYGVEIEGLTSEFIIKAPPFPWALVGGIIGGVLAAVIVYLLIRKRKRPAA